MRLPRPTQTRRKPTQRRAPPASATLLDLRTVGATHLTMPQATNQCARPVFEKEYVAFAESSRAYDMAEKAAWEKKAAEQAAAAAAEVEAAGGSSTPAAKESKPKLESGSTYGESRWSDDSDSDEAEGGTPPSFSESRRELDTLPAQGGPTHRP